MQTVRNLVQRLSNTSTLAEGATIIEHYRRLVLPHAAQFSLDGTILRTAPIPAEIIKRPGSPLEVQQLLAWPDMIRDGEDRNARGNDIGSDIAAILALASGRRIAFANETPIKHANVDRIWFLEEGPSMDGELYGPVVADVRARFDTVVRALVALPEELGISLGGAIRMRNAACCLVESDYSSAYGLLVAAIETLSRAFGNPPTTWADWDQAAGWDELIAQLSLDDDGAAKLRERLLADKQIRLKRTFVEYAVGNLDETFWQLPYMPYVPTYEMTADDVRPRGGGQASATPLATLVPTDMRELSQRIGVSYDARSTVFHRSTRLDYASVMPFPRVPKQPLPFSGLRRVLDYLVWREIDTGAAGAPDLPDVRLYHAATAPSIEDSGPTA